MQSCEYIEVVIAIITANRIVDRLLKWDFQ